MHNYLQLLHRLRHHAPFRPDRTGTGTYSLFGYQMRFDLRRGFPLLTTKRVYFKAIVHELIWFLKGGHHLQDLHQHNIHIWDKWATKKGELGPIYGVQWRAWPTPNGPFDQIDHLIKQIKNQPYSRRHIVSAWNVADLPDEQYSPQQNVEQGRMCLAPCHTLFQFYVQQGELSCQLYQRSADVFLGLPFNIASYALLTEMVAQVCHLKAAELIHTLGDVHLYANHLKAADEQLSRQPRALPRIRLDPSVQNIDEFEYDHIELIDYDPYPSIQAPISV